MSKLKQLNLKNMKLSGLEIDTLKALLGLRSLTLNKCEVEDAGLVELSEALPALGIMKDDVPWMPPSAQRR